MIDCLQLDQIYLKMGGLYSSAVAPRVSVMELRAGFVLRVLIR